MALKYALFLITVAVLTTSASAQLTPFENWTNSTGTQNFFMRSKTITDGSGNIYVAGGTVNGSGNYDILVSKFNSGGVLQWSQQMDGLAGFQDAATAIAVDGSGNVYITGFICDTLIHGTDAVTIKYNSGGTQQWIKRYNGAGDLHDFGTDLFIDGSGNVYITGSCQNAVPNADLLAIKYNSSGTQQWIRVFNYAPANLDDVGARIKAFASTKITVAGIVQLTSNSYAYGHLEFSTSTGATIGSLTLGTSSTDIERTVGLTQDADGNTFIAGAIDNGPGNGLDYCVIKFDTTAALVWESYYDGADGLEDVATDVVVDAGGYVYVTGYSTTTTEGTNYTTLKFTPDGNQVWESHLDGIGNGADTATALILHNDTTVVVTGTSFNSANQDYFTVKYDTTGAELWKIGYNSHYNKADWAHSIAVDDEDGIVITGQSYNDASIAYVTVRYIDPYIMDTLTDGVPESPSFYFIENRDQIIDTDGSEMRGIKFYNNQQEYSSYFTDTLISYVFAAIDTSLLTDDTLHRVDLRFINPLAEAKVYGKDLRSDYHNYYLPQTAPNGRKRVPLYGELYMPSLWENIDLKITSNAAGIKYAFILYPGFDPEQPSFTFEGWDDLYESHGELTVETSLGNLVLALADEAFQVDVNGDHIPLGWRPEFDIDHNIVTFVDFGSYDTDLPLVIVIENDYAGMPGGSDNLTWSTYYGGYIDPFYDVKTNVTNNVWVTGIDNGSGFPVSPGAFQASNLGNTDITIVKFKNTGERLWATYFGGSLNDGNYGSHGIDVDNLGNSFLCFSTQSQDIIRLNPGGGAYFDNTNDGPAVVDEDIFIAKFEDNGQLGWGTFFGNYGGVGKAYDITLDNQENLYIVGNELITPVTPGGTFSWSNGSAIIAKFNSSHALEWSTKFGGIGSGDFIKSIAIDDNDNILITGFTDATSGFPLVDPGSGAYYQNSSSGVFTGFVAKFNSSNALIWSTFFGGTDPDYCFAITSDKNENIIITGCSYSSDFPVLDPGGSAYYESTNKLGGSYSDGYLLGDLFVSKFSSNGNLLGSTFYGGTANDGGINITTDNENNIFICGGTASNDVDFLSPNLTSAFEQSAHSDGHDNSDDGYLLVLSENFEILWTSYIGGTGSFSEAQDLAYGITLSDDKKLYLVGSTLSNSNFPLANPGNNAYFQPTITGAVVGFISQFDLNGTLLSTENQFSLNELLYSFPNPTNGIIYVKVPQGIDNSNFRYEIFDVTNKSLGVFQSSKIINSQEMIKLDLSCYDNGVYLVKVYDNQNNYSCKIVLNK